jgi:hypothetical protein
MTEDKHPPDQVDANDQLPDSALELEVFNKIVSALRALPKDAQPRVLRSALTFLGLADLLSEINRPSHFASSASNISTAMPGSFSEDRTPSPKEFMVEKKPVTDIERITCLAYYLTHYRGTPHFKTLDLSKLNTDAAQIKFSNASVAVDNATAAGLLVPAGKGNKQISAIGEVYVQALPDREAARDAIAHSRPRRRSRRGTPYAQTQPTTTAAQNPNGYRVGTLYDTLFTEGSRGFIARDELIRRVAKLTGKSEKVVGFAYQVLKNPNHPSNMRRSTVINEGDKVKLIPVSIL